MFGLPSPALYVGAGLLALVISLGGVVSCQHRENGQLRDQKAQLAASLKSATDANESQSKAIGTLETANADWASKCTATEVLKQQAAVADEFRKQKDALAGELAKVKAHASPTCQTLLATDFGAVCPDVAGLMRERANGRGEGPHH